MATTNLGTVNPVVTIACNRGKTANASSRAIFTASAGRIGVLDNADEGVGGGAVSGLGLVTLRSGNTFYGIVDAPSNVILAGDASVVVPAQGWQTVAYLTALTGDRVVTRPTVNLQIGHILEVLIGSAIGSTYRVRLDNGLRCSVGLTRSIYLGNVARCVVVSRTPLAAGANYDPPSWRQECSTGSR